MKGHYQKGGQRGEQGTNEKYGHLNQQKPGSSKDFACKS